MSVNVYDRIRRDIASGELSPGAPLVELAMAARYGTSRTPIREALRRLEQDGMVERADRGMRVRARSSEEVLEIYDVRISLEATAARWAADRRTELDLLRLRRDHERMLATDAGDADAMAASNRRFHETLWTASHNSTLIDMLRHLNAHLTRYPDTTLTWKDRWGTALDEHARLIEAIDRRDTAEAAKIAEAHMAGAREIRLLMALDEDSPRP
ncbi:GntR family transcriptional regulator [Pseudonocardia acaciae]|uniref:GntR family transcriptional regulator n=1 Tax=Pseudonocardia acaciae TaxID=551276 RepID=UPI000491512B|nr:GntR family transcriptional regulator [Pseudonocardia acaciae]